MSESSSSLILFSEANWNKPVVTHAINCSFWTMRSVNRCNYFLEICFSFRHEIGYCQNACWEWGSIYKTRRYRLYRFIGKWRWILLQIIRAIIIQSFSSRIWYIKSPLYSFEKLDDRRHLRKKLAGVTASNVRTNDANARPLSWMVERWCKLLSLLQLSSTVL